MHGGFVCYCVGTFYDWPKRPCTEVLFVLAGGDIKRAFERERSQLSVWFIYGRSVIQFAFICKVETEENTTQKEE